jgi:putative ABC transport system substrate-binding protein
VIDRRAFILALGLLAAPVATVGQPPGKVPQIGVLSGSSPLIHAGRIEAFRQGLRERGYTEGRNIVVEYRYADGQTGRLAALAEELVALKVDVIVTSGDLAIRAARQASQTIPIVAALAGDLVAPGHVASLARPGGNITGLTTLVSELSGKRLELLKTAFPKISRVAVLWNPDNATNAAGVKEIETAARALGLQVVSAGARKPEDLEGEFQTIRRERADALLAVADLMLLSQRARIVAFAAKHRLPAMYGNQDYMDAGALMAYGPNVADLFRRAATYVDKILKGARPADLPVEQATKIELVINVKTAKALGLTIPPSLLARADHVIR